MISGVLYNKSNILTLVIMDRMILGAVSNSVANAFK